MNVCLIISYICKISYEYDMHESSLGCGFTGRLSPGQLRRRQQQLLGRKTLLLEPTIIIYDTTCKSHINLYSSKVDFLSALYHVWLSAGAFGHNIYIPSCWLCGQHLSVSEELGVCLGQYSSAIILCDNHRMLIYISRTLARRKATRSLQFCPCRRCSLVHGLDTDRKWTLKANEKRFRNSIVVKSYLRDLKFLFYRDDLYSLRVTAAAAHYYYCKV